MKKQIKEKNFEKIEVEEKDGKLFVHVSLPLIDQLRGRYTSYDTNAIQKILEKNGYVFTGVVSPATVINTSNSKRKGNLVFNLFILEKKVENKIAEIKKEEISKILEYAESAKEEVPSKKLPMIDPLLSNSRKIKDVSKKSKKADSNELVDVLGSEDILKKEKN